MAEQEFKRKLAAILSADAKGYSRLMVEDEEATVRTITAYRTAMAKLIQQYRGRVVDSPGDNVLAEFGSVVDAVNCAVEVQRELAERNSELPPARQMEFRIGINLGDVIEEGERIYGDGSISLPEWRVWLRGEASAYLGPYMTLSRPSLD